MKNKKWKEKENEGGGGRENEPSYSPILWTEMRSEKKKEVQWAWSIFSISHGKVRWVSHRRRNSWCPRCVPYTILYNTEKEVVEGQLPGRFPSLFLFFIIIGLCSIAINCLFDEEGWLLVRGIPGSCVGTLPVWTPSWPSTRPCSGDGGVRLAAGRGRLARDTWRV